MWRFFHKYPFLLYRFVPLWWYAKNMYRVRLNYVKTIPMTVQCIFPCKALALRTVSTVVRANLHTRGHPTLKPISEKSIYVLYFSKCWSYTLKCLTFIYLNGWKRRSGHTQEPKWLAVNFLFLQSPFSNISVLIIRILWKLSPYCEGGQTCLT